MGGGDESWRTEGTAGAAEGTTGAAEAAAPVLPEGWVQQVDPSTGYPYYVNMATGESTWQIPGEAGAAGGAGEQTSSQ
jgi:outer membrane protein assembly factor BamB